VSKVNRGMEVPTRCSELMPQLHILSSGDKKIHSRALCLQGHKRWIGLL
jgi:hypothetical protein